EKGEWIAQNGKVKDGKITVNVNHFSTYGVFAKKLKQEEPNTDKDNEPEEDPKEDPKKDPKPEKPTVDKNQDEEEGQKKDLLTPDKVYEIDYVIKQEDGSKVSISNDFFKKPAFLLEKDGKTYLQLTIENGDMIKNLSNKYGEALVVKKNKDGSVVVQLRVDNNLANMLLDMHIIVPSGAIPGFPGYDEKHGAILVFDKSSKKEVAVAE